MIKFGRGVPIASSATWSGLSDERRASQARAGRHGHRALRRASRSGDDPDRPQAGGRPRGGHDVRPLLLTGLWWVAYSLEVHNLPSLLSAVLGLLAPAYGLLVLWRVRQVGRGVAFVLVAGLVVTFLEEELTPRAMGVTAAVGAAGIAVPQAARLLRDRDRSAAGASIGTWALVAFNALVWLVYGVLVGHPLLGAAGLLQLPCSMIVIYYALRATRSREPQPRGSSAAGAGTLGPALDGP